MSHETIYLSLYVQSRGALRKELTGYLRQRQGPVDRMAAMPNGQGQLGGTVNISERPAEANDRAVPGHWEGDLLFGKRMHAIATLVERKTRFVMLIALPNGHTADVVADALAAKIVELPEQLRRSLTWDQGKEMADHVRFSIKTGVPVYFCDPRSPWQRGSNENTNGLLRQYFPSAPRSRTTPKPTSTPSPRNSTDALDKPSAGRHHHKHSTPRCDEPLNPQQFCVLGGRAYSRQNAVAAEAAAGRLQLSAWVDTPDSEPVLIAHCASIVPGRVDSASFVVGC